MTLTSVVPRLPVENLGETRTFYTELLGFRATGDGPKQAPTFLILCFGEIEIQFYSAPPGKPAGEATLSFDAQDVQELARRLASQVTIEWGPEVYSYGRREFGIRDPDGYLLIFSEETDDAPTCG